MSPSIFRRIADLETRDREVTEDIAELYRRVAALYTILRPTLNVKGVRPPMVCSECGAVYASEDGPPLCGPCWVAHGRPSRWPPITPLHIA